MLIDWGYEDRLIDRIAAREAMRATLNVRQKRIMSRWLYGDTYNDIADLEGVSNTRIRHILDHSISLVRRRLEDIEPQRTVEPRRAEPREGFDRAAFLDHMRLLIRLRAENELRTFDRERNVLAAMLASEAAKKAAAEAYKAAASAYKPIKMPVSYTVHPKPAAPLSSAELTNIAYRALEYFLRMRKPSSPGREQLGALCTRVVYTKDGGQIAVAVDHMLRQIPTDAVLSACPFAITDGSMGEYATSPEASLRAISTPDGLKVLLDITWDPA